MCGDQKLALPFYTEIDDLIYQIRCREKRPKAVFVACSPLS